MELVVNPEVCGSELSLFTARLLFPRWGSQMGSHLGHPGGICSFVDTECLPRAVSKGFGATQSWAQRLLFAV